MFISYIENRDGDYLWVQKHVFLLTKSGHCHHLVLTYCGRLNNGSRKCTPPKLGTCECYFIGQRECADVIKLRILTEGNYPSFSMCSITRTQRPRNKKFFLPVPATLDFLMIEGLLHKGGILPQGSKIMTPVISRLNLPPNHLRFCRTLRVTAPDKKMKGYI